MVIYHYAGPGRERDLVEFLVFINCKNSLSPFQQAARIGLLLSFDRTQQRQHVGARHAKAQGPHLRERDE